MIETKKRRYMPRREIFPFIELTEEGGWQKWDEEPSEVSFTFIRLLT
jgi:hypothetical protein